MPPNYFSNPKSKGMKKKQSPEPSYDDMLIVDRSYVRYLFCGLSALQQRQINKNCVNVRDRSARNNI